MSQSARSCRFVVVPFKRASGLVFLFGSDAALFRRPLGKLRQRLLDSSKAFIEIFLVDFEHCDVKSSHRCHLRNARAHQPTTQNAHFFYFHASPLLNSNFQFAIVNFQIVEARGGRQTFH